MQNSHTALPIIFLESKIHNTDLKKIEKYFFPHTVITNLGITIASLIKVMLNCKMP